MVALNQQETVNLFYKKTFKYFLFSCLIIFSSVFCAITMARALLPIWMGNEKYHAETKSELYRELGDEANADKVLKDYIEWKSYINNLAFMGGIEPK